MFEFIQEHNQIIRQISFWLFILSIFAIPVSLLIKTEMRKPRITRSIVSITMFSLVIFVVFLFVPDSPYKNSFSLNHNDQYITLQLDYKRISYNGSSLTLETDQASSINELTELVATENNLEYEEFDGYGYIYLDSVGLYITEQEENRFKISTSTINVLYKNETHVDVNFPKHTLIQYGYNEETVINGTLNDLKEYYSNFDDVIISNNYIIIDVRIKNAIVQLKITVAEGVVTFQFL